MALAKVSSKSQIVLPAHIRRRLGINPGDLIEITAEDETVTLRKAPSSYVQQLELCCSETWRDYELELEQGRDEWNH